MLRFPTKPRRAGRRIRPATGNARKAAQRSLKIECLEATLFRAHVSAAPLKRAIAALSRYPQLIFRAHVSAAPLKRIHRDRAAALAAHFRAHVSAAPLKRGQVG